MPQRERNEIVKLRLLVGLVPLYLWGWRAWWLMVCIVGTVLVTAVWERRTHG